MNIKLHVERLVLDGVPISTGGGSSIQAAFELELTRLLARDGLGDALKSSGASYDLRTANIRVASDEGPARLGERIAGAVFGELGK